VSRPGEKPLAELRARVRALRDPDALRRLAARLHADRRAGARALAESCERRARAAARERRRMGRLFELRRRLRREGARHVAGVDEVGMGPLAGPVVAGAVVLPDGARLDGLDDSKRLTRSARLRLAREIRQQAIAVALAEVWPEEIDELNIYRAGLEAMRRAVVGLEVAVDHVLVDARVIPRIRTPQTALVGGDGRDASIAAASVVAKVHRDMIMQRLDGDFPGYGFARHKGYATVDHLAALRRRGPTPVHRRSFAPVSQLVLF
jgi:ribonuclease HII